MKNLPFLILILLLSLSSQAKAQTPAPEREAARASFKRAHFGIMLHLGLYSVLAGGGDKTSAEWIQRNRKISPEDYAQLMALFNPTDFDADEIVKTCKNAGANFLNFTVKHADGFVLYDSKVSDFDVMNTSYGKDMLKEIANACLRHGLGLFLHYYQMDFHNPDYAAGKRLAAGDSTALPQWRRYLAYQNAQLRELLENYGPIRGIWLNGHWDLGQKVDWRMDETYAMIHRIQPGTLIANNHHLGILPGEDYYLHYKTMPISADTPYPQESFRSINNSWGYNLVDRNFLSADTIVSNIVKAAGYKSNFMLNVPLMPNGRFPPEARVVLDKVGAWMQVNGETVYATTPGPVPPQPWGVTTRRDDHVFVHILNPTAKKITLPDWRLPVLSVKFRTSNIPVKYQLNTNGLVLDLKDSAEKNIDEIIQITLKP